MLTVDPVKRATIAEIREMPYFQQNLPRYLQPLPDIDRYPRLAMDDLSTILLINEGQVDPKKLAEEKGMVWTEDLGVISEEIVKELLEKISAYNEAEVWRELQTPGDNQVKVAYQLVRDHKRILQDCRPSVRNCADDTALTTWEDEDSSAMEDFLASSPPAWNGEASMHQHTERLQNGSEELDWGDVDDNIDIQLIPNAHFGVLDSSIPSVSGPAPLEVPVAHVQHLHPATADRALHKRSTNKLFELLKCSLPPPLPFLCPINWTNL